MNRTLTRAKIRSLLVMDRERRLPLVDALESCGIEVLPVCDCNEARRTLETKPPVQVVITDSALPDGNWRRVLEIVAQECANIEVVVSLRLGDSTLWLDVLEQGGYDVLVEPYQHEEIRRIVEAAVARSHAEAISYKRMAHRFKRSPDGAAASRPGTGGHTVGMDAVELPPTAVIYPASGNDSLNDQPPHSPATPPTGYIRQQGQRITE